MILKILIAVYMVSTTLNDIKDFSCGVHGIIIMINITLVWLLLIVNFCTVGLNVDISHINCPTLANYLSALFHFFQFFHSWLLLFLPVYYLEKMIKF